MEQKYQNLEEVFRSTLEESVEVPSARVLQKLLSRLRISDFFSLNPLKFNVIYTGLLAAAIVTPFVLEFSEEEIYIESDVAFEITKETTAPKELAVQEESITEAIPEQEKEIESEALMLSAGFEASYAVGCAPLKVEFKDRSVLANTYAWDFGNGQTSDLENPSVLYSEPGDYKASLTITSKNGSKASYVKHIKVLSTPNALIDIDVQKSEIESKKVLFINKTKGATQYSWDFGDHEYGSTSEASHTYDDFGVYKVRLIAKANNGCSDTASLINKFVEHDYSLAFPLNFSPNPYDYGENGYYERAGSHAAIFYPRNNGASDYTLKITTSRGLEVFSTTDIKQGWNGYLGGRLAPSGVYNYTASGIYPNGQSFNITGRVKVLIEEDYY